MVAKMATLKEKCGYGLSCGRLIRGSNVSVFHVKLTDSALRALEDYWKCKGTLVVQPVVRFQGSQGRIIIPRPEGKNELRTFTFYLSNVGRDSPQGSFDCVQQYVTSSGDVQLDCLGSIQDKITVCATDDSYQKARQSMAQAEEETRSRSAIVIKPGGRYLGKRIQIRKAPAPGLSDAVPSRKRPVPVNLASTIKKSNNIAQKPIRDRVLHLLALKPYKKPELILRLQKDGATQQDKDALDSLLQEVANLNSKDNTYTLKDCMYKEVQTDWPGYSEGDQQLLKRVLARKLQIPSSVPGEMPSSSPPKDSGNLTSAVQKRLLPTEFTDPLVNKKPRISHLASRTQPTLNGKLNSTTEKDVPSPVVQSSGADTFTSSAHSPALDMLQTHDPLSDVSNDSSHSGKDCDMQEPIDRLGHLPAKDCLQASEENSHGKSKKKSKKHKDKEKNKEKKSEENPISSQGNSDLITCEVHKSSVPEKSTDLNGTCKNSCVPSSLSEKPDYLLKYTAISSSEQRQRYKNDFNAEYSEYRDLHARIERITHRFTQLDSELKQLSSGSEEYKTIHDQILQEYRKIKKSNPEYSQEKNRCEYLHNKLAHIKRLIAEYDHHQIQSWR
ncbi:RNA polymerase II elongation factor ELL [Protopterus annectens]|uniref:RNA polymerase II elongation factor ELL n=1 Tax=Protopterus annectens TaxID=7888 RepID=UPI001CFB2190|nr:RNA polymerase II elongation factor ELL [Protopterus annectens]